MSNVVLGTWLALSPLLFRDTRFEAANSAACGVLAIAFAVAGALSLKTVRLFNVIIGCWLLLTAVVAPHASVASAWNQGAVGCLLVAFAFVPRGGPKNVEPTAPVNW